MSLHLSAHSNEIAETVLITGDPLRAKHFAEKYLENATCYNRIRSMFGFTGTYKGKSVSIQGTGIGIPSTALYLRELIHEYKVRNIMRVGTCGALQRDIKMDEILLATEALSDSGAVESYTRTSLIPSTLLVTLAEKISGTIGISLIKGAVFSTDLFYSERSNRYDQYIKKGVLGADMETAILYAMGTYFSVNSLSLLTVTDGIVTGELTSPEHREKETEKMVRLALEIACALP